jgi:hypothetical protein
MQRCFYFRKKQAAERNRLLVYFGIWGETYVEFGAKSGAGFAPEYGIGKWSSTFQVTPFGVF